MNSVEMKKTWLLGLAICVVGAGLHGYSGSALGDNDDPVAASFERELAHQPGPGTTISGQWVAEDILYPELNGVHWTLSIHPQPTLIDEPAGSKARNDRAIDAIVASFEREFHHPSMIGSEIHRNDIEDDLLYRELNAHLWTQTGRAHWAKPCTAEPRNPLSDPTGVDPGETARTHWNCSELPGLGTAASNPAERVR